MSDTGFMFRASWPILDDTRPMSALRAEACRSIDDIAREAGCRIVGDVAWTFLAGRLVAQCAALPVAELVRGRAENGAVTRHLELIATLREQGRTYQQIADLLGCTRSAVAKAVARAA